MSITGLIVTLCVLGAVAIGCIVFLVVFNGKRNKHKKQKELENELNPEDKTEKGGQ